MGKKKQQKRKLAPQRGSAIESAEHETKFRLPRHVCKERSRNAAHGVSAGEDQIFDGGPVARRILRLEQSRNPRDVRSGHRSAAEDAVGLVGGGGQDFVARRGKRNGMSRLIGKGTN